MRERRLRLQQYLVSHFGFWDFLLQSGDVALVISPRMRQNKIKDARRQKEVDAAKEQLRMQKRAELLQQRILHKPAGRLIGAASSSSGTAMFGNRSAAEGSDNESSSDGTDIDGDALADQGVNGGKGTKARHPKPERNVVARQSVSNAAKVSEPHDFTGWKRQHSIPTDGKVFAMTGWYPCVKQCLLDR